LREESHNQCMPPCAGEGASRVLSSHQRRTAWC
jgi:hypothetical protein